MAVAFLALAAFTLWAARRGLDLGDESYLLTIIRDPSVTRAAGEPYLLGPLLHPFFAALGQDIAAFRIAGMVSMFGLAFVLSELALRFTSRAHDIAPLTRRLLPLLVVGTASTAFAFTPRIPSYRVLTVAATAVVLIGLLVAARQRPALGGALIGWGVATVLAVKLSSAVALLLLVPLAAWLMRVASVRLLIWSAGQTVVGCVAVLVICGMWPWEAVEYVHDGLELITMSGGYSLLEMVGVQDGQPFLLLVLGAPLSLIAFVGVRLVRGVPERFVSVSAAGTVLVLGLAAWGLTMMLLEAVNPWGLGNVVSPSVAVLPAGIVLFLLPRALRRREWKRPGPEHSLVLVLLLAPYLCALGSNQPFLMQMSQGAFFWVLALVVMATIHGAFATPRGRGTFGLFAGLAFAVSGSVVLSSWVAGGSVSLASSVHPVRVGGGTLLLPADTAGAMETLSQVRRDYALSSSTPMMDLTGLAPGYQFQLGGRPLGRAFFMPTFPTAERAARSSLGSVTCDQRAHAWMLFVSGNPYDLTESFDESTPPVTSTYETVATVRAPQTPLVFLGADVEVRRPVDVRPCGSAVNTR